MKINDDGTIEGTPEELAAHAAENRKRIDAEADERRRTLTKQAIERLSANRCPRCGTGENLQFNSYLCQACYRTAIK